MRIDLRQVPPPPLEAPVAKPEISVAEHVERCAALRAACGTDWVAVYGDREHFANLVWLSGYDPRFEEALLLLGPDEKRVLLVGIEGIAYADVARLPMDVRLYHPFSIVGQPNVESPPLRTLLHEIGLVSESTVGIAGWKTADPRDTDPSMPSFVPALIVRGIEAVTGVSVTDVSGAMIDPAKGLRTRNSATQIAIFEWGAARASAAVMRVVRGIKPGMTELDAAGLMGLQGEPATMHPIVSSSDGALNGLRSPSARVVAEGDAVTAAVGLWGGLSCRAGVMTRTPAADFRSGLIEPYFRAIATWWSTVGIGVTGGELDRVVRKAIGDAPFKPFVNAGHLTSYDEWVHSPVTPGNPIAIASGMAMQCDIIPTPVPKGQALNCEDSLAIGDESLRAELTASFPEVWARIQRRRDFMRDHLGITLKPEVLPLSVAPGYLAPCWLAPDHVCVARDEE